MINKDKNILLNPDFILVSCKLKLDATRAEYDILKTFSDQYQKGLNFVSLISFDNKLLSSKSELHKKSYSYLRNELHLPSQVSCSICREVGAKYKAIKTKNKNKTDKKPTKVEKPFSFSSTSMSFQYNRDFSFKHDYVSVKTLDGRLKFKYFGYKKHLEWMKEFGVGGGILELDKKKKIPYLTVTVKVPTNILSIEDYRHAFFEGIDVGQRKITVKMSQNGDYIRYRGKRIQYKKKIFARNRSNLQSKGTRSAKRRLRNMSKRESRFMKDVNHCISKKLAPKEGVLAMENLLGIRKFIEPTTTKKNSKKKKKANKAKSQWSFRQLLTFTEYKTNLNGSLAIFVDPWMTSRTCPVCGFEDKKNRNNELFSCLSCSHTEDADDVGGKNVLLRGAFVWEVHFTGHLSDAPEEFEARKLWWRERFQALRWSKNFLDGTGVEVEA